MKLVWVTDPHLNFLSGDNPAKLGLLEHLSNYEGIIISGDIGESHNFLEILNEIYQYTQKPIYYVLGNHDYYRDSVLGVRAFIETYSDINKLPIYYLTSSHGHNFGSTAIVGVDGWADAGYGNIANSTVCLNDSVYIQELFEQFEAGKFKYPDKHFNSTHPAQRKVISKRQIYLAREMKRLAKIDTKLLEKQLKYQIKQGVTEIIVVTHIPPFEQAAVYNGRLTDPLFLPFYTNKSLGDLLLKYATNFPEIKFEVLCGHTHNKAHFEPLSNLNVRVGDSEYYYPRVAGEVEIDLS